MARPIHSHNVSAITISPSASYTTISGSGIGLFPVIVNVHVPPYFVV